MDPPAPAPRPGHGPPFPTDQPSESTQSAFLDRVVAGEDPEAWAAFCNRYGSLIRDFARWHGLPPADCEDVVQDVYLALLRYLPGFRYDRRKGRFRGYLKTTVHHAVLAHRNKRHSSQRLLERKAAPQLPTPEALSPELEQAWEQEWRRYHIRLAMGRLRSEFNTTDLAAFERFTIQGKDGQEVAAEFGLSLDQVYQAKTRILKRLKVLVKEQIEDEG